MNDAELNIIKHGMKKYCYYKHIGIYKERDNKTYYVCLKGYDDKDKCGTIFGIETVSVYDLLSIIHKLEAFL